MLHMPLKEQVYTRDLCKVKKMCFLCNKRNGTLPHDFLRSRKNVFLCSMKNGVYTVQLALVSIVKILSVPLFLYITA